MKSNNDNYYSLMYTHASGVIKSKPPTDRALKLAYQLKGMAYRSMVAGTGNTKRIQMVAARLNNELRTILAARRLAALLDTLVVKKASETVFIPTATDMAGVNINIAMGGCMLTLLVGDVNDGFIKSEKTAFETLRNAKTCGYRRSNSTHRDAMYSTTLHDFTIQVNRWGGLNHL